MRCRSWSSASFHPARITTGASETAMRDQDQGDAVDTDRVADAELLDPGGRSRRTGTALARRARTRVPWRRSGPSITSETTKSVICLASSSRPRGSAATTTCSHERQHAEGGQYRKVVHVTAPPAREHRRPGRPRQAWTAHRSARTRSASVAVVPTRHRSSLQTPLTKPSTTRLSKKTRNRVRYCPGRMNDRLVEGVLVEVLAGRAGERPTRPAPRREPGVRRYIA